MKNFVRYFIFFTLFFPNHFECQESEHENFTWPLIAGYETTIPVGNLHKNMGTLHGFHVGFQFAGTKNLIVDMRIFAALGGNKNKTVIYTYKNADFESYIKSIYGAKVNIIKNKYLIPEKLSVTGNFGIGFQMYNSDKENKYYIKNAITGELEEAKDQKSEPITSVAPLLNLGTGIKYEIKKFPIGLNVSYTFAPHNIFGKMIQKNTGNSYFSINIYTGFIIPM